MKTTRDGVNYDEFNERDTKTCSQATTKNTGAFIPKVQSMPEDPQRCLDYLLEKFFSKRSPEMCQKDSPFYPTINNMQSMQQLVYKCQQKGSK